MMEFLYFPEDKTEYIPAVIELVIFMILAGITMHFFLKHSKKEAKQIDQQYKQQDIENDDEA
ncbi:hypothetical protein F3157_03205 [Virgibacillus dakarensis]|uniref:Uncharacterized protein n=1 Tax=Lentibacillus populi TaxID=1827502 RepID=A0A9W5TWE7_9BACI|nr:MULTISPECIES: hypothetical protein [Bacillaceae]MTW84665.1 hypothetical protein [Virgibacillus dakarensis]GGB36772.1 hypothetical protein GCM10011409_12770 [Lentibacillus populi]